MLRKTRKTFGIVAFILILLWIVPFRSVGYLLSEFVFCINKYDTPKTHVAQAEIPKRLHQVFFFETSPTLPQKLKKAQESCVEKYSSYSYTLWNKTMIEDLIDKEYPDIKELYHSYNHWVKRADVARYLVLHHYGGWYLDMDIVCLRSADQLLTRAEQNGASVVVRYTGPAGFSNDFIGISKQHPFLDEVLNALHHSKRNYLVPYLNTMFSTGPTFLWGRYLNYPHQNEFLIINDHDNYVSLLHNSSWHSFDGIIIWYLYRYCPDFYIVFACICALTSIRLYLKSNKQKRKRNLFVEKTSVTF